MRITRDKKQKQLKITKRDFSEKKTVHKIELRMKKSKILSEQLVDPSHLFREDSHLLS